jgi:hypothetical protein
MKLFAALIVAFSMSIWLHARATEEADLQTIAGFASLAVINAKLKLFGQAPRTPQAICVSQGLKAGLSK